MNKADKNTWDDENQRNVFANLTCQKQCVDMSYVKHVGIMFYFIGHGSVNHIWAEKPG